MKPMKFVVIGSGWRSLFFARIARAYPEYFELSALLCRTREKAEALRLAHGIRTTVSEQECEDQHPDFVVAAVNKEAICDVTIHWAAKGYPVLCETPAAMKRGYVGNPYAISLSMVHEYHAASLIRQYLGCGLEDMKLSGRRYVYPVMETDFRGGAITDGSVKERERVRITLEYEGGKQGFYDFSGVQYHSYIRSRHIQVQGERGELDDMVLRYVVEEDGKYLPRETKLTLCETEDGKGIASVRLGTEVLYQNPFGDVVGLPQDETAIASMMLDMRRFIEEGIPVYPLEEGLQDAYVRILMEQALEHPGETVESVKQVWSFDGQMEKDRT